MDFSYTPLTLSTQSLELGYFLVPWDSKILEFPVGQIRHLHVMNEAGAHQDFDRFLKWLDSERIEFCSCRIPHDRLVESQFLQRQGFRFIELNYRPVLHDLQNQSFSADTIRILPATMDDRDVLVAMAESIFTHGRFHQDPRLGATVGNRRYSIWMRNSFLLDTQVTYKCMIGDDIAGFFVVEYKCDSECFWSLIGLAPGLSGKGLGTRIWQAMAFFHQREGMKEIQTSISSHNTAVFNLYVKLGFRFPMPNVTLHWHRSSTKAVN